MIATNNMVLRVALLGAVATTEADITGHYVQMSTIGVVSNIVPINSVTNGTTPVTIVGLSGSANAVNVLKNLQIVNKDTAMITVIVEQFNGVDARQIAYVTIPKGGTMGMDSNGFIYLSPVITIDTPLLAIDPIIVASSLTSVSLVPANIERRMLTIFNDSGKTLYICIGATATVNTAFYIVLPNEFYRMERPIYQGEISGIWTGGGASGHAHISEGT